VEVEVHAGARDLGRRAEGGVDAGLRHQRVAAEEEGGGAVEARRGRQSGHAGVDLDRAGGELRGADDGELAHVEAGGRGKHEARLQLLQAKVGAAQGGRTNTGKGHDWSPGMVRGSVGPGDGWCSLTLYPVQRQACATGDTFFA